MKKLLRIPLLLVALLLTSIPLSAQDFEVNGIYYKITSSTDKTVAFDGCADSPSVVIIPETVTYSGTTYSVTSIGDGISDNIYILSLYDLTSITIPNSVTYISYALRDTPWYNNQPDGVVYISNILFCYKGAMPSGTSIDIKDGIVCINHSAFRDCDGLTSIIIPNSVTTIGDVAFAHCSGLTEVTIGNSVTSIGDRAFHDCRGLTEVTIPNSVTTIGESAFAYCSGLTEVTIGNSVTSIGYDAFNNCSGLTEVTIPNSVTTISYRAFDGCRGLTSVTIGNSVTSIGESAFYRCTGLTEVKITDLSAWCKIDFANSITSNPLYYAGKLKLNGEEITNLVIPNDVTEIKKNTFFNCTGLTSVTIPNSVTSIGDRAFTDCTGLTSVTIPNSVTSIGHYAFENCTGLTSVTIPNSVTSIGHYAFENCTGLTSVTIPNSVTSIGDYAFYRCHGLTSIISLNPEPPLVSSISRFLYDNTILYVPKGCVVNYSTAYAWADFSNIIELGENGEMPDIEVALSDGEATISFPKEENIVECKMSVYTTIPGSTVVKEAVWVDNASRSSSSQISMNVDGLDEGDYIYRISVKYKSGEIVEKYAGKFSINASGIDDIESSEATEIARYDIHGRRLAEPTKGINIIIYSDGSTKKEFVK